MPWKPPTHKPRHLVTVKRHTEAARNAQPHSRLLRTKPYRRFRLWLLRQRPMCERCVHELANEVHHKRKLAQHPEDLLDQDQCECLCKACHSAATAKGE